MAMTVLTPSDLPGARTLAIAPHPDDETLGCGGLLALLAGQGCQIHTVFVTEGGASHPRSRRWSRSRLAAQREREAGEALARLGLDDHPRTFLRLSDAAMPARNTPAFKQALSHLSSVVAEFRPTLALLPWRRDPHCDHRDSWTLARLAIEGSGCTAQVLEYAIWLDELGSPGDRPRPGEAEQVCVDVAEAATQKRHALAAYLSQTTALIDDDPDAFRLDAETIRRLTGARERYWRPLA